MFESFMFRKRSAKPHNKTETVLASYADKIACVSLLFALQADVAHALPEKVHVRLFDAFMPFSIIDVQGPFEVIKPICLRFSNELYRVTIKNDRIELRSRSDRSDRKSAAHPVIGTQLILASTTHRGVGLMPLGHQMRYYRGNVQMSINRKADKMHRPFRTEFRHSTRVSQSNPAIAITNFVPVEDYVKSVVGSETLPDCPAESTKAQAVLVLTKLEQMHESLISDSTQDQAYLGLNYARKGVEEAVRQVWNDRLVYDGRPVLVFFHSCCAGGTSGGVDIFGRPAGVPYLKGVKCSYCQSSNFWKPTRTTIDLASFSQVFGDPLPTIEKRDSSLRPTLIKLSQHHKDKELYATRIPDNLPLAFNTRKKIVASPSPNRVGISPTLLNEHKKTIEISGYQFWIKLGQTFGWDKVPGTRFSFLTEGNKVAISSSGAGHGVGLCQWGAAQQARLGKRYDEILRYYFPGTNVQRLRGL